jgi:hypothetical protein
MEILPRVNSYFFDIVANKLYPGRHQERHLDLGGEGLFAWGILKINIEK